MNPETFPIRDQNQDQAILLLHGFGGDSHTTFGMMPAFLAGSPQLYGYDLHCFGYPTALSPDITGVWRADPDLDTLAGFLTTALQELTFKRYQRIALVGHSMGGLVIQRALLSSSVIPRISHVVLFGTPSNGLRKALLGKLFKRQARDMVREGPFITKLRMDWHAHIGQRPPFVFRAVAGIEDEFVPRTSSVDVFEPEHRAFIGGNHLEMVKPSLRAADCIELLLSIFAGNGKAHVQPESYPAQERAQQVRADCNRLPEPELEDVVYAMEALGRDREALELLATRSQESTNLTGVLAGRLKRRWLADPEVCHSEGGRALAVYSEGYRKALAANDREQILYLGINVAFMELAYSQDEVKSQDIARQLLTHASLLQNWRWKRVTEGEAHLYLGEVQPALRAYETALRETNWSARELGAVKRQAIWVTRLLGDPSTEGKLTALFDGSYAE